MNIEVYADIVLKITIAGLIWKLIPLPELTHTQTTIQLQANFIGLPVTFIPIT